MKNTYALITGSSSGIGLEMAKEIAKKGYNLILVSIETEKLQELKEELSKEYNVKVEVFSSNLARKEAAQELYDYCKPFDVEILINNAGFFFFGQIIYADLEKAANKIQLHVLTVSLLCTLFGKDFKEKGRGYIMNTSSMSIYKEFPTIGYYGATKAYLNYFTRALRYELKYYGVNVTCLLPGATITNLYDPNVVNLELGRKTGIMLPADFVAKQAVKEMFKGKARSIPGLSTKLSVMFMKILPEWVIYQIRSLKMVEKLIEPKK